MTREAATFRRPVDRSETGTRQRTRARDHLRRSPRSCTSPPATWHPQPTCGSHFADLGPPWFRGSAAARRSHLNQRCRLGRFAALAPQPAVRQLSDSSLVITNAIGGTPQPLTCEDAADARRWRWDLNPRRACPLTRFRGVLLRPLGHATAGYLTRALSSARRVGGRRRTPPGGRCTPRRAHRRRPPGGG